MEDARVPRLRERLGVPGEATDLRYDAALADAVKEFQRANDLPHRAGSLYRRFSVAAVGHACGVPRHGAAVPYSDAVSSKSSFSLVQPVIVASPFDCTSD